jgi:hypothetical protein
VAVEERFLPENLNDKCLGIKVGAISIFENRP